MSGLNNHNSKGNNMAKVGVSFKLDVTKIDKARLFQGQKGTYLDATVFIDIDELDQYGNSGMITQDVTKEEKQQGVKGNILGNVKVFWKDQQAPLQQPMRQPQQPQYNEPPMDFDDDIPFAPVGLQFGKKYMQVI